MILYIGFESEAVINWITRTITALHFHFVWIHIKVVNNIIDPLALKAKFQPKGLKNLKKCTF